MISPQSAKSASSSISTWSFTGAPGKVDDIDIFMHPVADESGDTELYRFGTDQTSGAKIGTGVRIETGRGDNVIAEPCILMDIGECQGTWRLAVHEVTMA
jgi:hypothetical protein